MTQLKRDILKKIEEGSIRMRPRWPFLLQTILYIVLGILALIFLIFAVTMLVIALRESGMIKLVGFGAIGIFHFLRTIPWIIILGVFIALIIIEILFRKFSIGYKTPIIITLSIIIVGTLLCGIILSVMGPYTIRKQIRNAPFLMERDAPLMRGTIRRMGNTDMIIQTETGPRRVLFDRHTQFPRGAENLSVGTPVFVGGQNADKEMKAFGIIPE